MQYIKIEGVDIPDPASCDITLQSLDNKAGRNKMTGYAFRYKIAEKESISLTWGKMDKNKLDTLKNCGIHNQFFNVNYISVKTNTRVTNQFYVGDISFKTLHYDNNTDTFWCEGVSCKLIER